MNDSLREARDVLKETYGPVKGSVAFHILLAGSIAVAVLAILSAGKMLTDEIVRPVMTSMSPTTYKGSVGQIVLTVALTSLGVGVVATGMIAIYARWRSGLSNEIVQRLSGRLQSIEADAATLTSKVARGEQRISALEQHTGASKARLAEALLRRPGPESQPRPRGGY